MQIPILPARAGREWVTRAFVLLRRAPIQLMVATMSYLLLMIFSTALPLVGPFAPLVLGPALSIGLMQAMRTASEGRAPSPLMLFSALRALPRSALQGLLVLGVVNAGGTVLALGVSALFDQGALMEVASGQVDTDDPRLRDSSIILSIGMSLLVYTPVQMALWFAPLFVAWHGQSAGKALFFSLAAVMRNKWAFLQYGIAWLGVAFAASLVVQAVMLVLGRSPMLMSLVMTPVSLIVITAIYGSVWESYRSAVPAQTP